MGKILSIYSNGVDRSWFNSSNIVYSECVDKKDALKEVKVVFKNGAEYSYFDVSVQDYLMFREDASQGKALNKFLKKYEYKRHEGLRDLDALNEEKEQLLEQAREELERQQQENNTDTK